ncbi:MAG TPA: hypothetical protein PKM27_16515 [Saprospiraceae bacterium]|nr:hypothetical protein [Saprospiraceae bacterium]HNT22279.1 hypothetical protein [Saprospiraceae bacterium]
MKSLFFLSLLTVAWSSCNYITLRRHLNVNVDDVKTYDQSGAFEKSYFINTEKIINAVTENVNTEGGSIEKLEIESIQITVGLLPNNTASSVHNVHVRLGNGFVQAGESLVKLDTSRLPINSATVFLVNNFMIFKGVSILKTELVKKLATGQFEFFELKLAGTIPAGQVFRGSMKLIIKASMDVVTCERVPIGLGPSECMIKTMVLPFD